jgi:hypothetical protein
LGILSSQTGGVLIQNTNALDRGVVRINEDRRFYYLLGYSSTNPALDATYRKLEVKVKRPGVQVHARRGYIAAPDMGAPLLAYETPALAAMTAATPPAAFPIQTRAISVPTATRPGTAAVLVGVKGGSLTFTEDAKTGTYGGNLVVVASVSTTDGVVERKQSQSYNFSGKLDQLPKLRGGGILFFRAPELPAGPHKVTVAVYDAPSQHASVASIPLTIPPTTRPVVGDVFVVGSVERVAANDAGAKDHPLNAGGVLVSPSLGDPISKGKQSELAFALSILLEPNAAPPTATLSLLQNGQQLAQLPLALDAPAADGRLLQVSRLPTAPIPPGPYDLKVVVGSGEKAIARTTSITLVD